MLESVINQHPLVTIRTGLDSQMDTIFPITSKARFLLMGLQ